MLTLASPAVVAILSELIEERTGLHYGPQDRDTLVDKVSERAAQAGFDSLLDYYYYLRYDEDSTAELDRLIDALVVNETYLFREFQQLSVVVQRFIQPMVRAGRSPRVWCAACATGEEPATLAMMLAEAGILPQVTIVASDISQRALERARAGSLSRRSLRSVPSPELQARWIRQSPDGMPMVDPELLAAIDFRRVNLAKAAEVERVGRCDVILCRNVLIYFSDETTSLVVSSLAGNLSESGVLFVGVSESLLRFSTALLCEEKDSTFYYRKVG
jgi:chemotaxis protein methyltransferase CheR